MANKNYLYNKDNKSIKTNHSLTTNKPTINQQNLNKSFSSKQKFSYEDKVRGKKFF